MIRTPFPRSALCALTCLVLSACSPAPAPVPADPGTGTAQPVVEIMADWPYYGGLDAVIARSDAVVTVTFLSSTSTVVYPDDIGDDPVANPQAGLDRSTLGAEDRARLGVPTTVSLVRVDACLRGDLRAGDTIQVVQTGGVRDGVMYRERATTLLGEASSAHLVLVLNKGLDGATYLTVDPVLGVLAKSGDALVYPKPYLVDEASLRVSSLAQLTDQVRQAPPVGQATDTARRQPS